MRIVFLLPVENVVRETIQQSLLQKEMTRKEQIFVF
jgi:hypothetical protein